MKYDGQESKKRHVKYPLTLHYQSHIQSCNSLKAR